MNARSTSAAGLFALVVVRVDLDVLRPLRGHGALLEDRAHRAGRLAGAAVNALLRVDLEHINAVEVVFALSWMNAVHRAYIHAGSIFDTDTGLRDYIRHGNNYSSLPERMSAPDN